jgi:hypothetical protein
MYVLYHELSTTNHLTRIKGKNESMKFLMNERNSMFRQAVEESCRFGTH